MKKYVVGVILLFSLVGFAGCTGAKERPVASSQSVAEQTYVAATTTQRPLTKDQRFLDLLQDADILVYNRQAALKLGHSICDFRRDYPQYDPATMAEYIAGDQDSSFPYTVQQTKLIVEISTVVYCPQYS